MRLQALDGAQGRPRDRDRAGGDHTDHRTVFEHAASWSLWASSPGEDPSQPRSVDRRSRRRCAVTPPVRHERSRRRWRFAASVRRCVPSQRRFHWSRPGRLREDAEGGSQVPHGPDHRDPLVGL
jgi:hypothetical protein